MKRDKDDKDDKDDKTYRAKGAKAPNYVCSSVRGGCDGLSVRAEPFEREVVAEMMRYIDSEECRALLAAGDEDGYLRTVDLERRVRAALRGSS